MPAIGVNNEPLLDRRVFGYDGTNYRVVKLDTDGNLVVALKTTEDVQANTYGWIGGDWQKNPLLLGYSGTITEEKVNTSAAAGTNTLNSTAVPSGEVWILHAASARNTTSAITQIVIVAFPPAAGVCLTQVISPAVNQFAFFSGNLVLEAGQALQAAFYGCVAGDDIYLDYVATRVDLDQ